MERLLVERVVATWLQLSYFESLEPLAIEAGEAPRLAQFRARRLERAQRAHLTALAALTTLRRLLPAPASIATGVPGGSPAEDLARDAVDRDRDEARGAGRAADPAAALPPPLQNRLAGLFDRVDLGADPARPGRTRVAVAAEN